MVHIQGHFSIDYTDQVYTRHLHNDHLSGHDIIDKICVNVTVVEGCRDT